MEKIITVSEVIKELSKYKGATPVKISGIFSIASNFEIKHCSEYGIKGEDYVSITQLYIGD